MPQESTCKLPFTTTGLSFAVNDSYITYKGYAKKISECCTIHQLYRYTLAQFEYQCSRLPSYWSSDSTLPNYLDAVKKFPKNFECIVSIVNSFGRFTEASCQFLTVAPPVDAHSPHTVRLINLRAIVERLSTDGDKDFVNENTLPGALYDADGVLQNPDDIMPATYDEQSFLSDARAVEDAFSALYKFPGFVGVCEFSDEGNGSCLVSTALEKNGPYDSISKTEEGVEKTTVSKSRDWYSIHSWSHTYTPRIFEGILSYCGVWSEKLEEQWPLVRVRYPGSSKEVGFDQSWSREFLNSHDRLVTESRFTAVRGVSQPVTCRVPFTTTGLAFTVNDLYAKYRKCFADHCTIHQLYRYTLVQFEFQCYVVGQVQHQACYYPYYDSFFFMYKRLDSSGVIKAYAENFKSIATIIDSYGYFQREKCKFGNIPPPIDVHHPDTIRVCNLRAIVEELAAIASEDFKRGNTLPGAVFNAEGLLENADDIMPADYDDEAFLEDARAVRRAFQMLKRDEFGKDSVGSCQFSDKGKPSTLVSVSAEEARDSIPTSSLVDGKRAPDGKIKVTRTSVEPRRWYSIYSINDTIMKFGILSYCGVWSESLEKKWPDMKVRNPAAEKQLTMNTWNADEKFLD